MTVQPEPITEQELDLIDGKTVYEILKEGETPESLDSKITLISAPFDALKTIYTACRTCYSSKYPDEIWGELGTEDHDKMLKLVSKVMESGHLSTVEHCNYVFSVSGISRACSHQLVRHRHMSFSQKSQRYVKEKEQFEYIVPAKVKKSSHIEEYHRLMREIQGLYSNLVEDGVPPEDARAVLPNATATSMIISLNLREFIHLANLRLCVNAQHEIRKLVRRMVKLAIDHDPWLKDYLVIKCEALGYCDEIKCCGLYPPKNQVVQLRKK